MKMPVRLLCVAFAATALVACGGGGSDDKTPTAFPTSSDPSGPIPTGEVREINLVLTGGDFYAGGDNNFVFAITDDKDQPVAKAKAKITFYDLSERSKPKPVGTFDAIESAPGVGPTVEHVHADGEVHIHGGQDDNRVVYYVPVTFPHAGQWGAVLDAELPDGTVGQSDVGFNVREKALFPVPGEEAYPSDNLTKADVEDIAKIDSGTPPNDMHDVKIKDSIEAGRPLVLVFSTPAYCTSRFCGPVTEEIESLHDDYDDKVDFVHIEIWLDFEKKVLNPTAKEWLEQSDGSLTEPWVYVIDKNGVIYDRWESAASRVVVEDAVKAVAAGETYEDKAKPPALQ